MERIQSSPSSICQRASLLNFHALVLDSCRVWSRESYPSSVSCAMQIKVGKDKTQTVTRSQYPITGAYSFTDYRSQGQTITHVIIDITSPPTGKLSLFNLHVALSPSSGRNSLRLLRDFDDKMFLQCHEAELMEEDEWLERLDVVTKGWWERMRSTEEGQMLDR